MAANPTTQLDNGPCQFLNVNAYIRTQIHMSVLMGLYLFLLGKKQDHEFTKSNYKTSQHNLKENRIKISTNMQMQIIYLVGPAPQELVPESLKGHERPPWSQASITEWSFQRMNTMHPCPAAGESDDLFFTCGYGKISRLFNWGCRDLFSLDPTTCNLMHNCLS